MTSAQDNSLDDIFGSSPPREHEATTQTAEPSDLPSLRRQHITAGYRDGVSAAKGQHVQSGFDAGFPVGAQLGMRAGTVLGILEGVLRGYESRAARKPVQRGTSSAQQETEADQAARRAERERILGIYQRAVKELDVRAVFALDNAIAGEGNEGWNGNGGEEEEKPEVLLRRKGDVMVSKWEGRVQVAHWEENMDVLEPKVEGQSATES